jgi:imidazolonepropionase-like amidohydrolase
MTRPLHRWLFALLVGPAFALAANAADLAIVGAKLYPSPDAAAIERGTIVLRDGRIAAVGPSSEVTVPAGASVIDGFGAVVVAGFWNSHVHLLPEPLRGAARRSAPELEAALATMFTRWGFTTVFDIASLPGDAFALRRRIDAGEIAGPAILSTDAAFFPRDGTPIYVRALFAQVGAPNMEVATPAAARERARAQLAAGADGLKLFAGAIVGGPMGVLPMDLAVAEAIVDEAHRAGKPAFAHPTDLRGLEIALASGVDVLAHPTSADGPWPPTLVARIVAANMALTPTLALFEIELARERVPPEVARRILEAAQQQVGAFARAGGRVLFGTDLGYIDEADPRREYTLMAGAGLDWRAVLASLTTHPAERFGQGRRKGRLDVGMEADLVVLASDPAVSIEALGAIRQVIRGGRVLGSSPGR